MIVGGTGTFAEHLGATVYNRSFLAQPTEVRTIVLNLIAERTGEEARVGLALSGGGD